MNWLRHYLRPTILLPKALFSSICPCEESIRVMEVESFDSRRLHQYFSFSFTPRRSFTALLGQCQVAGVHMRRTSFSMCFARDYRYSGMINPVRDGGN